MERLPQPADAFAAPWRVWLGRFAGLLAVACLVAWIVVDTVAVTLPSNFLAMMAVASAVAFLLALFVRRHKPLLVCASVIMGFVFYPEQHHPHAEGREAGAIRALRQIHSAEAAYSSSCAQGGYATDLADLVRPPVGTIQDGFIATELGYNGITRNGYVITLSKDAAGGVKDLTSQATPCNGSQGKLASSYFASANPVKPGVTGSRYFATDTRGTIFYSLSGPVSNPIPRDTQVVQ